LLREPTAEEVVSRLPSEVTNPKELDPTKTSGAPKSKPAGATNQTQVVPPIANSPVTGS